ncbi:amidophosphoribosyltransferase [Desulfococcaceae bacterium OttesenSCG-928-F15]|nr:amidophosphoribosyltransferase [Desulfococcaceae bacterium OttesenSCG-928-F15]
MNHNSCTSMDRPADACGVVGLYGVHNAAAMAVFGLHALQHRGQESAGIATSHQGELFCHKGMGLVANVFSNNGGIPLPGDIAIGHVRYSTAGPSDLTNAQPLLARYCGGEVAVAHNGNLAAGPRLAESLAARGALFQTSTDTELFLHLLAQSSAISEADIAAILEQAGPAFALVMLYPDRMIAARDPWGIRPLVLGRMGQGHVVASETCAFDQMGASYEREVLPGEMIVFDENGVRSRRFGKKGTPEARCLLEHIYFARPDSVVFGETPHITRYKSGQILAAEHPVKADIVVAIPDSGLSAAQGYSHTAGIPLERGLIRNHYVGRSFIAPGPEARTMAVKMKHNVVREVVRGKRVVLVDDSLIRGTTTASLSRELRAAGAVEVHLRIACPPTRHPCRYGVDFSSAEELLAYRHEIKAIQQILKLDSLGYLSLAGLVGIFGAGKNCFCTACWSGIYCVV